MANESNSAPSASDALHRPERKRPHAPESPARTLLTNFFAAMSGAGDDAEDQYRRALTNLRKYADLVIVEIARSHSECNAGDYPTRWAHDVGLRGRVDVRCALSLVVLRRRATDDDRSSSSGATTSQSRDRQRVRYTSRLHDCLRLRTDVPSQ